jgi:hypothetical protein
VSRFGLGDRKSDSIFSDSRETGTTLLSFPRAKMRMQKLIYFIEPWKEVLGEQYLQSMYFDVCKKHHHFSYRIKGIL